MLTRLLLCKVSMHLFPFKLKKLQWGRLLMLGDTAGSQSVIHLLDEVEVAVSL